MIIHYSVDFIPIKNSFKHSTFNRRIVSGKNIKAMQSVVYLSGMTKDFEDFLILSSITPKVKIF